MNRSCLAVLMSLACSAAAYADGFVIIQHPPHYHWPHPTPPPALVPAGVKFHNVTVDITDTVAVTKIKQAFYNPNAQEVEGKYIFPFADDVAVQRFAMMVNGKELKGEVLDKDQARKVYEEIVAKRKDPALLEYIGTRMFQARVYPIPASGQVEISLEYTQTVPVSGGLASYRYPLNTEKFSSTPLESASVTVNLKGQLPLGSVFCPSHSAKVTRSGDTAATVSWEERNVKPDKDFIVGYASALKEVGVSVLTYRESGDEGYFMARIVPPSKDDDSVKPMPKDIVFVMDTSGSMNGTKIEQARKALLYCLNALKPEDRFNIVTFSTEVTPWKPAILAASTDVRDSAKRFVQKIEAAGGTNIDAALRQALAGVPAADSARARMIVFVTDGMPTVGEQQVPKILANVKDANGGKIRLFVFGVGDDVNTQLLDSLAEDNGGNRDYVSEKEDLEVKLSDFYKTIADPVMTELKLDMAGAEVSQTYPGSLPDLFAGRELVVFGRYKGNGSQAITLTGKRAGQDRKHTWEHSFPQSAWAHEYLPRLWAQRKVGYLLDQMRRTGENKELKDEVIRLARKYGIVTPYTSMLVQEDTANNFGLSAAPAIRYQRGAGFGGFGRGGGGGNVGFSSRAGRPAVDTSRQLGEMKAAEGYDNLYSWSGESNQAAPAGPSPAPAMAGLAITAQPQPPAKGEAEKQEHGVRQIGAKTFYLDAGRWVDGEYDGKAETQKLKFLSEEYTAFLKDHPEAARWLALGPKVVFTLAGRTYETVE